MIRPRGCAALPAAPAAAPRAAWAARRAGPVRPVDPPRQVGPAGRAGRPVRQLLASDGARETLRVELPAAHQAPLRSRIADVAGPVAAAELGSPLASPPSRPV